MSCNSEVAGGVAKFLVQAGDKGNGIPLVITKEGVKTTTGTVIPSRDVLRGAQLESLSLGLFQVQTGLISKPPMSGLGNSLGPARLRH